MILRLTLEEQYEIKFGLMGLGSITLSQSGTPLQLLRLCTLVLMNLFMGDVWLSMFVIWLLDSGLKCIYKVEMQH